MRLLDGANAARDLEANLFAAAGGILYRKALAEGSNKVIPTEWLGSDLSAYYKAGFRPSP